MAEEWTLCGRVVQGKHLGRQIGFPTANLVLEKMENPPTLGVYAAWVYLPDGSRYAAVTNVGVRPTVELHGSLWAESCLLDFDGDLYGQELRVTLCHFLRPERRFESVEALRAEITRNAAQARQLLLNAPVTQTGQEG